MKRPIDIPPFLVMEVLERAQELERQGRDIIHLEVGEPDFPTPERIKEAAMRALRDGQTHYSASVGILPLREAVCVGAISSGAGSMPRSCSISRLSDRAASDTPEPSASSASSPASWTAVVARMAAMPSRRLSCPAR